MEGRVKEAVDVLSLVTRGIIINLQLTSKSRLMKKLGLSSYCSCSLFLHHHWRYYKSVNQNFHYLVPVLIGAGSKIVKLS